MYIRKLVLKNIKCFEDEELSFVDEAGNLIKWTVILGENGTGKSVILQTIGLLLSGIDAKRELIKEPRRMVRYGQSDGEVTADIDFGVDETFEGELRRGLSISQSFTDRRFSKGWGKEGDDNYDFDQIISRDYMHRHFVCGYGATRVSSDIKSKGRYYTSSSDPRVERLETLFSEESHLVPVDDWLKDLEYRSLRFQQKNIETAKAFQFDSAKRALSNLLPSVEFKEIDEDGEVIFATPYGNIPISELSRGYRDVLTWVSDLMRRLIEAFPGSGNPLKEPGIVLVEEISLHLHPVWQKKVIAFLRERFPNIQFIVTTHSPLTVQSLRKNEAVMLQEVKKKPYSSVSIKRVSLTPNILTTDQILTSPIFGLPSSRSIEIQKKSDELNILKKKISKGKATEKDEKKYARLRQFFEENKEAPGVSYEQRSEYIQLENILKKAGRADLLERPPIDELKKKKDRRDRNHP